MKTVLTACALLSCCSLLCAQPQTQNQLTISKPQPRPSDPAALSNMLAKTGGILQTPVTGPSIVFLNTQDRVSTEALRPVVAQLQKVLRLPILLSCKISKEPVSEALKALTDKGTAAVIVIGDSSGYPSLLVAPESHWAFVNIAALSEPDISMDNLTDRTCKEACRAFGYVMGAANSNQETCLLRTVLHPSDLDALKAHTLSPEAFNKILAHAQKIGIKTSRMTTYRKAVEEGWAPAPTNDFQRAIWQELKK